MKIDDKQIADAANAFVKTEFHVERPVDAVDGRIAFDSFIAGAEWVLRVQRDRKNHVPMTLGDRVKRRQ